MMGYGPCGDMSEKALLIDTIEKSGQHIHTPVWPVFSDGDVELTTLTRAAPGEADERIRSGGLMT